MQRLTLELPDSLLSRLKRRAASERRQVEEVIVEQLSNGMDREAQPQDARRDELYADGELFEQPTEEGRQRCRALAEEGLSEIGRKLAATGPLSETVIEERRQGL